MGPLVLLKLQGSFAGQMAGDGKTTGADENQDSRAAGTMRTLNLLTSLNPFLVCLTGNGFLFWLERSEVL